MPPKGYKMSAEAKKKISLANKGHKVIYTQEWKDKIGKACSGKNNGMYGVRRFGKNNPNWRGGVKPLRELIRQLSEYKKWVQEVFNKDSYLCQSCGINNKKLEAHHVYPFVNILNEFLKEYDQFSPIEDKETLSRLATKYSKFWDNRNGQTLCYDCHQYLEERIPRP